MSTIAFKIDPLKEPGDRLLCRRRNQRCNRVPRQLFNTVFDLWGDNNPVTLFYIIRVVHTYLYNIYII